MNNKTEQRALFMDDRTTIGEVTAASSAAGTSTEDTTPPKFTSTLNKSNSNVIKPIAFKPLTRARFVDMDGQRYGSTPILARPSSHMAYYGSSSELHRHSKSNTMKLERKLRSVSPIAMSSLPLTSNHKLRLGYDSMDNIRKTSPNYTLKDCTALSASSFRAIERATASEGCRSLLDLTPSPCESSSFVEMEAALRERDYELSYLRQTMEHNEQVIFKVYQEKEHTYERELRKLKALHENRLRAATQKSLKLEQMLMMQTYQLQEEKKRLRDENVEAVSEISALREEINSLRIRLEDTEWSLCQKSGELAHIKSQLKDSQGEQSNRGHEVLTLKKEIRQLRATVEEKETELLNLHDQITQTVEPDTNFQSEVSLVLDFINNHIENAKYDDKEKEINGEDETEKPSILERLKMKIKFLITQWTKERISWEEERNTWANEKQKVLCYQKQLQLNYIEMYRRNKALEAEFENLPIDFDFNSKSNHKEQLQNMSHAAIQL